MLNSFSKLVAVCSLVGVAIFAWSATGSVNAQAPASPRDPEIRRLQQERLDLAKLLVSQEVQRMNVGASTVEDVMRSAAFLAEAELEVAESNEQIVAAREKQVEIAKEIEARATKKVAVGSMTTLDKQLATYSRLGAEIELLKAKRGSK